MAFLLESPHVENSTFWEYGDITDDNGFDFERVNIIYWRDTVKSHWALAIYASAIYLVTIFGLQNYMKSRPAFNLRVPLILWNAALGIFSIIGFVRTAPIMGNYLKENNGLFHSVCTRAHTYPPIVYWGIAFAFSKFIELGDTLFIVLRKRPLQLLQWYHHIMTLIVVWVTLPYAEPVGRWYIIMNYGVHSFMYPYFALKMAHVEIPKVISNMITTAQFAQMIAGFMLNAITIALLGLGYECYRNPTSIAAFVAVYGSFIVLFGRLFVNSVLKSSKKGSKEL